MKDLEVTILQYLKDRRWDKLKPADIAKSISIEASELLEIFQWSDQSLAQVKKDAEKIYLIKKELADVMICCLEMTSQLGIDTRQIILDKLAMIDKKYPAKLMRDRKDKAGHGLYLEIKKEYRRKGKN